MAEHVTRQEVRRRLALHKSVADHLRGVRPDEWQPKALENIRKARAHASGLALDALAEWESLILNGGQDGIREACQRDDEHGDFLRVMSPFAGILPEADRRKVLLTHPHS